MGWLSMAGLVMFWAALGGGLDWWLVRDTGYARPMLALRYLAASSLIWIGLCLPLCLALGGIVRRFSRRGEEGRAVALVAAQAAAILVPWTLVALRYVHKSLPRTIPVSSLQGILVTVGIVALAAAVGLAAVLLLRRRGSLSGGRRLATAGWAMLALSLALCVQLPARARELERPNLLLISIDSLRADVFEEYVERHASPVLRRFVAGGRRYHNAHTTFSHSLPSHASMFTGLYPPTHGAVVARGTGFAVGSPLDGKVATAASRLTSQGYETIAILANAWIGAPFGLEAGFETYVNYGLARRVGHFDLGLALNASVLAPYLRYVDARFVRTVHPNSRIFLRWLETRDSSRPFFAFLHYIEMHTPNNPPPEYRERFVSGRFAGLSGTQVLYKMEDEEFRPSDMRDVQLHLHDLHMAALARMDDFLQPVLEELMDGGWLDDTIVFLVSDHGENLYEKAGTYGKSHVYHTSSRVPFVLRVPGESEGSERSELVSLVDVAATLQAAGGLDGLDRLQGVDLLSDGPHRGAGDWIYVEGWDVPHEGEAKAVLFGSGYKWIRDGAAGGELYDLASDPGELRDLSGAGGPLATAHRERFDEIVQKLGDAPSDRLNLDQVPEDTKQQLRALGYLQ